MNSDLRIDLSGMGPPPPPGGGGSQPRNAKGRGRRRLLWAVLLVPLGLVAPFVIVIRGGLEAEARFGLAALPAVALGVVTAATLLFLLAWIVAKILGLPGILRWIATRGAALAVLTCVANGLFTVAAENVKTPNLATEYRSLHPLLRLGTAALVLVDPEAVVTDASRTPEDYAAWGLDANQASLHFIQDDGYAHALDLRTRGRSEFRNLLARLGFELMGFETLRHTGTADHLHIAMPGD